jgi:hypothetical protein
VIGHGVLRLTLADGTSGEVDVLAHMRGPVFERARAPEGFREAHIAEGTSPGRSTTQRPDGMHHRFRPSSLLTAAAVVLLFVAMATLRDAPADITAAVIVLLVMLAGIGASVDTHAPRNRRR